MAATVDLVGSYAVPAAFALMHDVDVFSATAFAIDGRRRRSRNAP